MDEQDNIPEHLPCLVIGLTLEVEEIVMEELVAAAVGEVVKKYLHGVMYHRCTTNTVYMMHCTCTSTCTPVHLYMYMCTCTPVHVYMYLYTYMGILINTTI